MTSPTEPDPIEQWLAETLSSELLVTPLSDSSSEQVIDRLKQEADRYWYIDPKCSLEFANRIILIGTARDDTRQIALGHMAKGDAYQFLGQIQEAWKFLTKAGELFISVQDEIGWARTRIGRLVLSPNLNCVSEALIDAEHAHEIFTRHKDEDKLVRLEWQTGLVQNYLGNQGSALELFQSALNRALVLGEQGEKYLGFIYDLIGLTYSKTGNFLQALAYYDKAHALADAQQNTLTVALIEASIAEVAQAQGQYRRALTLLNTALEKVKDQPYDSALIQYHMVECYLSLNRVEEARETAEVVIQQFSNGFEARFELARTQLFLATAAVAEEKFTEAEAALGEAEALFSALGATNLVATIRLWRGRMALRQGDSLLAYQEAVVAASAFDADNQQLKSATANLLQGQALLARGDFQSAFVAGEKTLQIAQTYSVPSLRYAAHLLLGQAAEAQNQPVRAARRYQAATATIHRVQRGLTLTLRPDFLEDKGEAARRLIALHLQSGNQTQAFETLENTKSQNWLAYLTNRERLHWLQEDAASRALIDELETLRADHHFFYRQLQHLPDAPEKGTEFTDQTLKEMKRREQRMRAITEQLYLRSEGTYRTERIASMSATDIQQSLADDALLVEYYNDGETLWAFKLDRQTIQAQRLPATRKDIDQWVAQLQGNIAGVLKLDPHSAGAKPMTSLAQRILGRLHASLIAPLKLKDTHHHLIFVPYGALHFLPFHLLHDGTSYLIEKHEVVILPTAGLSTRPAPHRPPGALALAHSWDGRLPHTVAEAQIVQKLFGGEIYAENETTRATLGTAPVQILHLATHGQHRPKEPDLSFLQLADGQLYGDDVLQQDLSYELVTLSACETGRARVAAADDLIGIGRSFLYAGAGALVTSLWQVGDQSTLGLMGRMYAALRTGASKASALRQAQVSMLAEHGNLHPAFWGAFQLIGNAEPLSR